jgi:magnesium chelatase family protein
MSIKNLATVYSAELEGIDAKLIEVEIDINVGIHSFNLVGLADKALNEARERVNSALKNSGVKPPNRENRKITINLAPADFKKAGSQYDLAIAIGYLVATKQMQKFDTADKIFLGELALDGRLRAVNGVLNIAQMASERGFKYLFLPAENASEAAAIREIKIIPLENLQDAIAILEKRKPTRVVAFEFNMTQSTVASAMARNNPIPDFSEIKGQENAKRALTIAAAGGHNLIMTGSPGVGKSFLARAFAGILPTLALNEAIEVTKIWSAAGLRPDELICERPFRAPHQTASTTALVGGGSDPRPGEISLAHRGVLFLDEIPEFKKEALEALRQPMESGFINVSRAKSTLAFPAQFILIAAMNPCPCGYYGDIEKECKCSAHEVIKYQKRISGPLLDRIDLQIKLGRIKIEELQKGERGTAQSELIKQSVERARALQHQRFETLGGNSAKTNSEMTPRETQTMAKLDHAAEKLLETFDQSHLSPRGYYRLLKVARTIADLEDKESVSDEHLAEAFSYRLRGVA